MVAIPSKQLASDFKFFPQEYGKFRVDILDHFVKDVLPSTKVLLDPMGGTASLLPYCQKMGITSYYSDIIPVHTFVNKAKTIAALKSVVDFEKSEKTAIDAFLADFFGHIGDTSLLISDSWFHDDALESLRTAWKSSEEYEEGVSIFIKAVILLTVRSFSSSWSSTSNAYWHRPGGISLHKSLGEIIPEILARFRKLWQFYEVSGTPELQVSASFQTCSAKSYVSPESPDTIITSPPYPNRFDYARMFGPELFFMSKVGECSPDEIKLAEIATNSVKGYFPSEQELDYLTSRSELLRDFIDQVYKLGKARENHYYYRYFVKYYVDLFETIDHLCRQLAEKGSIHFVVQNNIHRGELNSLADYCADCLSFNGLKVDNAFRKLRRHQGTRNISKEHSVLVKKHHEIIIRAERK